METTANIRVTIMNDYLALYQSVYSRTGEPMDAWNTICVGMFTHPDFWMY